MAEYPNEAVVVRELMRIGRNIEELEKACKIAPGIPCKPMLAKPTKEIGSILTRF
jgi:DNA ligase-1